MLIDLILAREELQLILEVLARARESGGFPWEEPKLEAMRALSAKIGQQLRALEVADDERQAGDQ